MARRGSQGGEATSPHDPSKPRHPSRSKVTRDFVGWVKLSVQPNKILWMLGFLPLLTKGASVGKPKMIYLAINEKWYYLLGVWRKGYAIAEFDIPPNQKPWQVARVDKLLL